MKLHPQMMFKFRKVVVFLLILCVIVSFQSGVNFLLKVLDKPTIPQSRGGQKHLLLLATGRTGSSFVGEFFNQQKDDVAYLFEPLWHVERRLTLNGQINLTATAKAYPDVLRQLFLCNFSLFESFMNPYPADHITSSFFGRDHSSFLCEEPVCNLVDKELFKAKGCGACGPLNLTKASESCLQKKHRVIKVVRLRHFHILQPLAEDTSLDIKFLQLVRDPRAILSSRFGLFPAYKNLNKWAKSEDQPLEENDLAPVKRTCESLRVSAELGLSQPPWLHKRYMLVRYEDIAQFPIQKAAEMYQFYGMPFTPQMKSWILNSTSKETKGALSTQKNSNEHIDKWRSRLSFKLVELIQTICEPTMRLFGYKFVTSEKMLRDTSMSLVEDKDFTVL